MIYEVIVPSNKELTKLVLPTILGYRKIEDKQNTSITCPICEKGFITSTDAEEAECPKCGYKFELQPIQYDQIKIIEA